LLVSIAYDVKTKHCFSGALFVSLAAVWDIPVSLSNNTNNLHSTMMSQNHKNNNHAQSIIMCCASEDKIDAKTATKHLTGSHREKRWA
jgi:hypothetical protein